MKGNVRRRVHKLEQELGPDGGPGLTVFMGEPGENYDQIRARIIEEGHHIADGELVVYLEYRPPPKHSQPSDG